MAAGTNATAVWAIAFSTAAVLHDAGQHAGASRMEAMSNEARTCASIRCCRCMSTSAIVDEQGEAGSDHEDDRRCKLVAKSATMVPITTSVSATLIQKF